ncbi:heme oxygenase-like, multi-helical [Ascosphaera apis ARSEF 7405]|uniref:Heme oxygenase-like, multi-helical n=1 Tax=Ascosphaera apis ARSEF 7405 TaxID=392613 RepID=A0A162IMQ6_9EURO|nr:heme oxygenase-like, multi-helical [Ascosphaera apis ARSEF 7405]
MRRGLVLYEAAEDINCCGDVLIPDGLGCRLILSLVRKTGTLTISIGHLGCNNMGKTVMESSNAENFSKEHLPRQSPSQVCFARELFSIAHEPLRKLVGICIDRSDHYVRPSTYHLRSYANMLCAIALPILNYEHIWMQHKTTNADEGSNRLEQRHAKFIAHLFMPELRRTDRLWHDISIFGQAGLVDRRKIPVQKSYSHKRVRSTSKPKNADHPGDARDSGAERNTQAGPAYAFKRSSSHSSGTVFETLSAEIGESLATKPYLIIAYIYVTSRLLFDYGEGIRQCLLDVLLADYNTTRDDLELLQSEAFSFWSFEDDTAGYSKFKIEQQFEKKLLHADSRLSKADRGEIIQEVENVIKKLQVAARSINWKTLAYYANEKVDTLRDKDQSTLSQWWGHGRTHSRRKRQRLADFECLMYHVRTRFMLRYDEDEEEIISEVSPKSDNRRTNRGGAGSKLEVIDFSSMWGPSVSETTETHLSLKKPIKLAEAGSSIIGGRGSEDPKSGLLYWRRRPPVKRRLFWRLAHVTALVITLFYDFHYIKTLSGAARKVYLTALMFSAWCSYHEFKHRGKRPEHR